MRTIRPLYGETRVVKMFAWYPITCGRETRWLEKVEFTEIYTTGKYWSPDKFIN